MSSGIRIFQRGLTEYEVAIIKRMRLMKLPRDYIFSFIIEPGRVLTPACIAEVEQGKIGREVSPATKREVEIYVARRLLLSGRFRDSSFMSPISADRVRQVLRWFEPGQLALLPNESQAVEYKMYFNPEMKSLVGYVKTMAAFANNEGGYIIFGVSDDKRPCEFDETRFIGFSWDRLQEVIDEYFGGNLRWEHDVIDDGNMKIGVLFAAKREGNVVVCEKSYADVVTEGGIYYRYSGESRLIKARDLKRILAEPRPSAGLPSTEAEGLVNARRNMRKEAKADLVCRDLFDEPLILETK